jgi:hypothetical protein
MHTLVLNKTEEQSCTAKKKGHVVLKDITPGFTSADLREHPWVEQSNVATEKVSWYT